MTLRLFLAFALAALGGAILGKCAADDTITIPPTPTENQ